MVAHFTAYVFMSNFTLFRQYLFVPIGCFLSFFVFSILFFYSSLFCCLVFSLVLFSIITMHSFYLLYVLLISIFFIVITSTKWAC